MKAMIVVPPWRSVVSPIIPDIRATIVIPCIYRSGNFLARARRASMDSGSLPGAASVQLANILRKSSRLPAVRRWRTASNTSGPAGGGE